MKLAHAAERRHHDTHRKALARRGSAPAAQPVALRTRRPRAASTLPACPHSHRFAGKPTPDEAIFATLYAGPAAGGSRGKGLYPGTSRHPCWVCCSRVCCSAVLLLAAAAGVPLLLHLFMSSAAHSPPPPLQPPLYPSIHPLALRPGWDKDLHYAVSLDFFKTPVAKMVPCGNLFEVGGCQLCIAAALFTVLLCIAHSCLPPDTFVHERTSV